MELAFSFSSSRCFTPSHPRRQRNAHLVRPHPHAAFWKCSLSKSDTVVSWNVNSLRSLLRKQPCALKDLVRNQKATVLCLQETKIRRELEAEIGNVVSPHWFGVYHSSTSRIGYSGTAVFSERYFPSCNRRIGHEMGDDEGRSITIELTNCFVMCVYTMHSGERLTRLSQRMDWDSAFRRHIRRLRALGKGVIVLGDLNVARGGLDVWSAEALETKPGFSDYERESFEETLESCGLVDMYRELYPTAGDAFTTWGYRTDGRDKKNGMRLDYALVSDDILDAVRDVRILDRVTGSDHCPIALDLKIGLF